MQKRTSLRGAKSFGFTFCTLFLGALIFLAAAQEAGRSPRFTLNAPNHSFLLANNYPRAGLQIDLLLRYVKPGAVLDTVGLNAAPRGAWAVSIGADGRLVAQVFDGNWILLSSAQKLAPGEQHHVVISFTGQNIGLRIGDSAIQRTPLTTPLSGQPVWVGDFPGDDQWGPKYNIHNAFMGEVTVLHFGAPRVSTAPPVVPPSLPAPTTGTSSDTEHGSNKLPAPVVLAQGTVGPAGGTLEAKGVATLRFPAGALLQNEQIVVRTAPATEGHFIQVTRTGSGRLSQPVRVAFKVPQGVDLSQVAAFHEIAPGVATAVPSQVNLVTRTLEIEVRHFSVEGWMEENFSARSKARFIGGLAGFALTAVTMVVVVGAAQVTVPMILVAVAVGGGTGYALTDPVLNQSTLQGMSGPIGRPGPFHVWWDAGPFTARPQVWEVSERQSGNVLGYFSPADFPGDPLVLQQTQGAQNSGLPGANAPYTWAQLSFRRVPADIIQVLAKLQYTRAWYEREGFTVPPRPMAVVVRPGNNSGEFDGVMLFLNPRGLIEGGEWADDPDSAIGHEYFHAISRQNNYGDGAFVGREESLCVAFESLVFPDCDAFLTKDSIWANVYPVIKNGLMSDGTGEGNTTPGRRGYLLWPWPKFLYHRYGAQATRDYAANTMTPALLSQRWRAFAYSLLASDQMLLDPVQVVNLNQRRMVSRTGWKDYYTSDMAESNARQTPTFGFGVANVSPSCPLSLRAFKVNVPRNPGGYLVIRRPRPVPSEEFVALQPQPASNKGTEVLGRRWTAQNMVSLPGGGVVRAAWTDSKSFSDLMGLAVIGNAASYNERGDDARLLVYRLNPPSGLKMSASSSAITRLQWTLPDLGAPLKLSDCLLGYRLLGRTKTGQEDLIGEMYFDLPTNSLWQLPGKITLSIPATQTQVDLPSEKVKPYAALGLQSIEKVLQENGRSVLSRVAWSYTPCTLAIEPATLEGRPNKPYTFTARAEFPPDNARFSWTLNGQPLKSTQNTVTVTFPAPTSGTSPILLVAQLLDDGGKQVCSATMRGTIKIAEKPSPPTVPTTVKPPVAPPAAGGFWVLTKTSIEKSPPEDSEYRTSEVTVGDTSAGSRSRQRISNRTASGPYAPVGLRADVTHLFGFSWTAMPSRFAPGDPIKMTLTVKNEGCNVKVIDGDIKYLRGDGQGRGWLKVYLAATGNSADELVDLSNVEYYFRQRYGPDNSEVSLNWDPEAATPSAAPASKDVQFDVSSWTDPKRCKVLRFIVQGGGKLNGFKVRYDYTFHASTSGAGK